MLKGLCLRDDTRWAVLEHLLAPDPVGKVLRTVTSKVAGPHKLANECKIYF